MWFDSHCHLDFEAFDADREAVVGRARAVGIAHVLVPGVSPDQWRRLRELRQRCPEVCVAVGLHPWFIHEVEALDDALASLDAACEAAEAVAIGETGLDSLVAKRGGASLELQRRAFERHVLVAKEKQLPLILHIVRAHGAALTLLERMGPLPGGVLHSYSGSAELVPRYARLGLSFGLSGAVTRPGVRRLREAAAVIPDEHLLLETDAPDQAPEGWTRSRNEPSALVDVAREVARLRNTEEKTLLDRASANARRLFL